MATNHSVTVTAPVDVEFECVYCGHARAATVAAEGYGSGTSFIFFDRNAARARAAKEADASLLHDAKQSAKLLECPKCRRRSRAAVTKFVARTVLLATPFVLGAVALVYLWPQWKVYLGAAGLMACVVVLALSKRKQFKRLPAWGAVIARVPTARALPASAKAAALPVVIAEKPEAQVATAPSEAPRLLR